MELKGANKQFSFLKISLDYDKSDQHNTLYDRYNAELAATVVASIKLENANNNYSIPNKIKFAFTNENDKYLLYEGCSVAPLTEYVNNEIYHELPRLDKIYDKKRK